MVRLWHRLVRLGRRLRRVDRLRLVELVFVAGILLVLGLRVNVMISHEVLEWFAQDHEHYHALFTGERAYLDGLSAAVLPALARRDPRELVEALDRAQGGRYAGIEPRFAILELRDGTLLTSSDARRFPAESVVVPDELRRRFARADGSSEEPGADRRWLVQTLRTDGFRVGRLFAEVEIPGLEQGRRDETSRLRWSVVIGCLMAALFALGIPLGTYFVLKRTLPGLVNRPFLEGSRHGTAGTIAEVCWIVIALLLVPAFNLFQPSFPPVQGPQFTLYQQAIDLLYQADYPAAEAALKSFIQQYPDDRRADDAKYWLGETYYARGNYAEAATAFAKTYAHLGLLPSPANMAPEVLLKVGISLARANQKQQACEMLHRVLVSLDEDIPNWEMHITANAIKERAEDEKKKLGC